MRLLRGRVITRKRWRHLKRQLKRRGVNPDWWWAPYEIRFIVVDKFHFEPVDPNYLVPILFKR